MGGVKISAFLGAGVLVLAAAGAWSSAYEPIARWIVFSAAVYTAFAAYEKNKQGWLWCMVFIAIVFNPGWPADFDWRMWRIIDIFGVIAFFMASKLP